MDHHFVIERLDRTKVTITPDSRTGWRVRTLTPGGQSDVGTCCNTVQVLSYVPAAVGLKFRDWLGELKELSIADDLASAIGLWAQGDQQTTSEVLHKATTKVNIAMLAASTIRAYYDKSAPVDVDELAEELSR